MSILNKINWSGFIIVLVGLGTVVLLVSVWPYRYLVTTAWLVLRVSPYEQVGVPDGPVIVVLGDSTAYGTGAARSEESVAGRLGQVYTNARITNISGNGWTLADIREAVPRVPNAALIVVMAGGNDILRDQSLEVSIENLRSVLRELQTKAGDVILMPPGNVGGAPVWTPERSAVLTARTESFRTAAMAVSTELGIGYVDLYRPPAEDEMVQSHEYYLSADQLHPSSAGYDLWFSKLSAVINDRASIRIDKTD